MATDQMYREFQRRSHKLLGAYLVFWAWTNKVSCVVLPREQLLPYLGLERRMENERIEWLKEDLIELFPYLWWTASSETNRYETLYLSRFKIPPEAKEGAKTDLERVELLKEHRLKAGVVDIPTESEIIKMMSELSHGILDFAECRADAIYRAATI